MLQLRPGGVQSGWTGSNTEPNADQRRCFDTPFAVTRLAGSMEAQWPGRCMFGAVRYKLYDNKLGGASEVLKAWSLADRCKSLGSPGRGIN